VFHRLRIGLRIGKHAPFGSDYRDADAAGSHLRNPSAKACGIFGMIWSQRRQLRRISYRDVGDGSELFETGAFIIAPQSALGVEIDWKKDCNEQREKSKAELPKEIKPHGFRTSTPRPGRSSNGWGFPDRIRFFRAGGGRKRPRCAALRIDPFPKPHQAIDLA